MTLKDFNYGYIMPNGKYLSGDHERISRNFMETYLYKKKRRWNEKGEYYVDNPDYIPEVGKIFDEYIKYCGSIKILDFFVEILGWIKVGSVLDDFRGKKTILVPAVWIEDTENKKTAMFVQMIKNQAIRLDYKLIDEAVWYNGDRWGYDENMLWGEKIKIGEDFDEDGFCDCSEYLARASGEELGNNSVGTTDEEDTELS